MFFYQSVDLCFKTVKPVKDAIDVRVQLRLGYVLSGNLFAGLVNKHLKAFYLVIHAFEKEPYNANAYRKYSAPDSLFHLSISTPEGFC